MGISSRHLALTRAIQDKVDAMHLTTFHLSCHNSSKLNSFTSLGMWHGLMPHLSVNPMAAKRLEESSQMPMPDLTTYPESRLAATQPWTDLSMKICQDQMFTLEASCGNGYAPVRGMLMMMVSRLKTRHTDIPF